MSIKDKYIEGSEKRLEENKLRINNLLKFISADDKWICDFFFKIFDTEIEGKCCIECNMSQCSQCKNNIIECRNCNDDLCIGCKTQHFC